ncbi:type 1 glutamine amidotransferase domain-containing protein [Gelidibacter salicanalis]|uniref:Type 1 glutamine amidotransferase domain-containing protein n=2 Tax=Gelidibacter salicanalis TaxID=291193 RepID=A0A5C7AGM0_9FLAO|nr:type 1 glutamine amidotransferase domain-containing protein [Gelidibacter salicanalis]
MVVTSHKELLNTDSTTGLWIGEFTDPYYEFRDKNYTVVIASPQGGQPPIDPMSKLTEHVTGSNRRFMDDDFAKHALKHTLKLDEVSAADFDAVFYPGGHGPMFDLASSTTSAKLIVEFLSQHKPVAAVCHGPAALLKAAEMEPSILKGKKVTGFSNAEEKLVFRSDTMPYTLEDKLKEMGAEYHMALLPFSSHVETDGLLITGQNPLSAGPTAEALIAMLETK